jgi:hypothetical protein
VPVSKKQRAWAATPAGIKALGAAKANEWLHYTNAQITEAAANEKQNRKKPTRKPR